MKFLKFLLFLFSTTHIFSQSIIECNEYESNFDESGNKIEYRAQDHIKLFYDQESFFKYEVVDENYFRAKLSKILYPTSDLIYTQKINIENRPDKNYVVGSIDAYKKQNTDGSFNYIVPIKTVKGSNNFQPKISLVYNSNAGNGLVGWGWNIAGLSCISRNNKDYFHDNTFDKINFTNLDKLVIDGNRLVVNSGSEGNENLIYATEIGNSMRIYPHNLSNSGFEWFEVKSSDGTVYEYGRTTSSRLELFNGTFQWYINKIIDNNGNYMIYEYGQNNGEIFIKSIKYTGNNDCGLKPYASLNFEYKLKSDFNRFYINKNLLNQTVILTKITSKMGDDIGHEYLLDYINNNGYSQLYSLKEYGLNGSQNNLLCYNPTIFEYKELPENIKNTNTLIKHFNYPEFENVKDEDIAEIFGDFNGDKISDRILVNTKGANNTYKFYLQFGKFTQYDEYTNISNSENYSLLTEYEYLNPDPNSNNELKGRDQFWTSNTTLLNKIRVVDINRDGNDDIIVPYLTTFIQVTGPNPPPSMCFMNLRVKIFLSNGQNLNEIDDFLAISERIGIEYCFWSELIADYIISNDDLLVGDFDGDNYFELIINSIQRDVYKPGFLDCESFFNDQGHYYNIYYFDLSLKNSSGEWLYNENLITSNLIFQSSANDNPFALEGKTIPINYNNDNKTDILLIVDNSNDNGVYNINNNEFQKINSESFAENWLYYPGDFNGDGLTDLLYYSRTSDNKWYLSYNVDGDFASGVSIYNFNYGQPFMPGNSDFNNAISVCDYNGDGKSDILWYSYDNSGSTNDLKKYHFYYSIGVNNFVEKSFNTTLDLFKLDYKFINDGRTYYRVFAILDYNGDGILDIYNSKNITSDKFYNYNTNTFLSFNNENDFLYLQNIYDGFNNKTNITFDCIANNEVYSITEMINTFPIYKIKGGAKVISSISEYSSSNFADFYKKSTFYYKDLIFDLMDCRFLGYSYISSTLNENDNSSNYKNEISNEIKIEPQTNKKFLLQKIQKSFVGNDLIEDILLTNNIRNINSNQYFVYQSIINKTNYLNGIKEISELEYNDYGSLLNKIDRVGCSSCNPNDASNDFVRYSRVINTYGSSGNINTTWNPYDIITFTEVQTKHIDDINSSMYIRKKNYQYFGVEGNYNLEKIIDDPDKSITTISSYEYDAYGNIIKSNYNTTNENQRNLITLYDNFGRFLTKQIDKNGIEIGFDYDNVCGYPSEYIDENKNSIFPSYDYLGNLSNVLFPFLDYAFINYSRRWSNLSDPDEAVSVYEIEGSDQPTTKNYFDSFNRNIYQEQESFYPHKIIRDKNEYFSDGRIKKYYKPYNSVSAPNNDNNIEYIYDNYKRITNVKDLNFGNLEEIQYGYNSEWNCSISKDGKLNITYLNDAGDITEIQDNENNSIVYTYNNNWKIKLINPLVNTSKSFNIAIEYNEYGLQSKLIDRDAGTYNYFYNGFSELIRETNPKGEVNLEYDDLGRLTKKIIKEPNNSIFNEFVFNYIDKGNGIGNIKSIKSNNVEENYNYNEKGFLINKNYFVDNISFNFEYSYYDNGFLNTITYPSGVKTQQNYNNYGFLDKILRIDNNKNTNIFELKELDDNERIIKYSNADNKIQTNYTFIKNKLTNIKVNEVNNIQKVLQDISYEYYNNNEFNGFTKKFIDTKYNQSEEYLYDEYNRLSQFKTNNVTVNYSYNPDGSIRNNSNLGNYYYNSDKNNRELLTEHFPHAIKELEKNSIFEYLGIQDHNIEYTPFNSVRSISNKDLKKELKIDYSFDDQRIKMEYKYDNDIVYSKYYLDDYIAIYYPDNSKKEITFINGVCSIVKDKNNLESSYYLLTDKLGSITGLFNENGELLENSICNYDPKGNIRDGDDWNSYLDEENNFTLDILGLGFTSHEHISEFGLINMNGRLYDRQLGQFIQTDNKIQDPTNIQSYNRYSYCFNNPINFIDPSGEDADSWLFFLGLRAINLTLKTYAMFSAYNLQQASIYFGFGMTNIAVDYFYGNSLQSLGIRLPYDTDVHIDYGKDATTDVPGEEDKPKTDRTNWHPSDKYRVYYEPIRFKSDKYDNNKQDALKNNKVYYVKKTNSAEEAYRIWWEKGIVAKEGLEDNSDDFIALGATMKLGGQVIKYGIKSLGFKLASSKASNIVCFTQGTLVETKDGKVKIENLTLNDSVWTYNIQNKKNELNEIKNIFVRDSRDFARIYLNSDSITCTLEHPFFVNNTWVEAKELKAGDLLFGFGGNKIAIDSIYSFKTDTATKVYNLEVAGNNDYYVSASGVLVHNCNIGTKLEYVFGKATGNVHNIARSKQMNLQLNRIGIFDNQAGRSYLTEHLKDVFVNNKGILQPNGRILRESLLMGPNGGLKMQSIWDGNNLITIQLFGK